MEIDATKAWKKRWKVLHTCTYWWTGTTEVLVTAAAPPSFRASMGHSIARVPVDDRAQSQARVGVNKCFDLRADIGRNSPATELNTKQGNPGTATVQLSRMI